MKIRMAEPLHLVIQGEGKNLGKKMILLRLVGCNINCRDCDTSYTWNSSEWHKEQFMDFQIQDLTDEIKAMSAKYKIHHLLITGGEPALWEKQIIELIQNLNGFYFDIETSGYSAWNLVKNSQFEKQILFNISPKIGVLLPREKFENKKIEILVDPPLNFIIKIVVSAKNIKNEIHNVLEFQKKYQIDANKIYLMPFARTREELLLEVESILNYCYIYGFEFSPRLHILMFDSQRLR